MAAKEEGRAILALEVVEIDTTLKWPVWIGVVCENLEAHFKDAEGNLFEIVQRLQ